jgi:drug/metabolite transporter (DMT)-like permease
MPARHPDSLQRHDPAHAALLMLTSTLLFAVMAVLIKHVSATLPNEMVVFFRNSIGLLVLLPWLLRGGLSALATRNLRGHLLRSTAGLAAMYCYFYAIGHIPLAEATLLNYSTPLFIPLVALVWLGERPPRRLWPAVLLGFAGIALILKPGMGLFTPAALIGVAAGLLTAVAMTGVRGLTRTEPPLRIVFYFSLIATLVSSVPLAWAWRSPSVGLWALLLAVGAVASAAQVLMTRAYAHAPAAQVGPFSYAAVVFAGVAGWLWWEETLDVLSLAGILLVSIAGAAAIRRENVALAPAGEIADKD